MTEINSSVVNGGRMRGKSYKLRFKPDIWKNLFPKRTVKQWNRLPWEVLQSPFFGSWKHNRITMWTIWSDLWLGLETSCGPSSGVFQCYYELTNMIAMCMILIKHFTYIFLSHWRSRQIHRSKTLTWITLSVRNYSEYIKTKCKNTCFEFIFLNCMYRNYSKGQRVFEEWILVMWCKCHCDK